jgi:hypothetical protein
MEQIAQAATSPTHYSHQWHLDEAKAQRCEQLYLRRPDTRVALHHPRRCQRIERLGGFVQPLPIGNRESRILLDPVRLTGIHFNSIRDTRV